MSNQIPEDDEYFRIENIAYDVGLAFGSTTNQGIARARRCIYRAALALSGFDRRWTWLQVKDTFDTVIQQQEYSLRDDMKVLHQMWMQGTNRQRIDRIPTSQFVERVPNPDLATGIPRLFDEQGVDSSGAKVISLYPNPNAALTVYYRFTKRIMPPRDPSATIQTLWGMPAELLEPLVQKATAFALQGVNSARYEELNQLAEMLINDAYACDQAKPHTTYRAVMVEGRENIMDGPMLPSTYGWD